MKDAMYRRRSDLMRPKIKLMMERGNYIEDDALYYSVEYTIFLILVLQFSLKNALMTAKKRYGCRYNSILNEVKCRFDEGYFIERSKSAFRKRDAKKPKNPSLRRELATAYKITKDLDKDFLRAVNG